MAAQFLFLFLPMIQISKSLDVNLGSIRMVPDLYQLCWGQYTANNDASLKTFSEKGISHLPIFKDNQTRDNIYCVKGEDKNSLYSIELPLWGLPEETIISIPVIFSMPFTHVLPVIRKKIVSNGVHFHLSLDFAGIFNKSEMECQIIIIYGQNKTENKMFNMKSLTTRKQRIFLDPGTEFDFYYYCYNSNLINASTKIATDRGTVFPVEKTQPLQPFLRFAFTGFLVVQWKNPPNVIDIYQIEIYEVIASNRAKCLKVFRLYSSSKPISTFNIYPENCHKGINTEDLGTVDLVVDGNVYVVLGVNDPLKKDVTYKLSIWWRNASNQWEENFIYFEPLPNENSGKIHSDIYNYDPSNYQDIRNNVYDMRQNVIPQYSTDISSARLLKLSNFDEMMILPTVSLSSPFKRLTSPKTISYDELNEKCNKIPSCSNQFYPLFYVMLTNKSQTDNFVELLQIPLKENIYMDNLKSSSHSENGTLIISFDIPKDRTYTPSLFAIRLRWKNHTCYELDVLLCRTCNKEHKEVSEKNFNESFSSWKRDCQKYERFDNHYGAMDSSITVQIKQIIPGWIPTANIYSVNLYDLKENIEEETFWHKYGTIVIGLICTVISMVLILLIVIWLNTFAKKKRNRKEKDDHDYDYDEDTL